MATVTLWVGTRKGAFALRADSSRRSWQLSGPLFLGHVIHHVVQDPRAPRALLMAAKTGHLGPTVYRSLDRGRKWQEVPAPPAFPKAGPDQVARAVERVFWLTPGHSAQPGVWYAGTSPAGLFRSDDGQSWAPLNEGVAADFLPDPTVAFGHDPHCVTLHPLRPDRLYQQNHCGVYRLDRPARRWQRIGMKMPAKVGDIGFPILLHPREPDTAWVVPMDGTRVWPRTSVGGRPAVYETRNGGASWRRRDRGLPRSRAWFTVLRQALCGDNQPRPGLYFGTTGGEIWASTNTGGSWRCIAQRLPEIYSVTAALH